MGAWLWYRVGDGRFKSGSFLADQISAEGKTLRLGFHHQSRFRIQLQSHGLFPISRRIEARIPGGTT